MAGCSMPATGAADAGRKQLNNIPSFNVDFLDSGAVGSVVTLVHSSVSGARQRRRLMEDLKDRFRVRAVNLFGYRHRGGVYEAKGDPDRAQVDYDKALELE